MRQPFYKRKKFWLWFAAIYVGFGVIAVAAGLLFGETEPETTASVPQQTVATPQEQMEPDATQAPTIESIVREAVGDENYVSHEIDEGVLYIDILLASNWTADMAVKSAYDKIATMSEQIRDNGLLSDATAVHYFFKEDLTDAYGNVTQQNVLGVKLSEETLAKINFDNFSSGNLPNVADAHFRHAATNK